MCTRPKTEKFGVDVFMKNVVLDVNIYKKQILLHVELYNSRWIKHQKSVRLYIIRQNCVSWYFDKFKLVNGRTGF